jgi:glycogen(starch) synthase
LEGEERKLKVLMLTWEYPPRIIGGIAPHVYDLSKELSKLGVETTIVTCDFPDAPSREHVGNVDVHRVDSYKAPTPDFPTWIYTMNLNLQAHTAELLGKGEFRPDIIHAHDWLVAEAAIGLKHMFRLPLVATIHSTESGRRSGIHSDYQKMLHETEIWLAYEAWKIICCSDYMANHLSAVLGVPSEKIVKIPNGVNFRKFMVAFDKQAF